MRKLDSNCCSGLFGRWNGDKTAYMRTSGHEKVRFTAVLACLSSGLFDRWNGDKTAYMRTSGHEKVRFTAVLACLTDGMEIKLLT